MNKSSSLHHSFNETHLLRSFQHQLSFCIALLILAVPIKAQDTDGVVAKVNRQVITQAEVDESVSSQVYALQQQLFALRKAALSNLITKRILEDEAARQNLSIDQLKNKWMSGSVVVDPVQVNELYVKNLLAFGLMSADEAKEKLRLDLEGQVRLKRYREALNELRQLIPIEVFLEEPRVRVSHNLDSAASKGPVNAKVVITEFSDFQCPYCKEVQANLNGVMQRYPDEVRLEFKHLPLDIHSFALTAARAAYCGGKQGAFWKVHDALFAAVEPSREVVQNISRNLNLNVKQFETCLLSEESQAAVMTDLQEARRLGIAGTPSFVINGRLLRGVASVEEFNEMIKQELKNSQLQTSTSKKVKGSTHD